ncbi:slipin family protein [bacterium]|nr:slipin family protein [bacterium]
MRLENIEKYIDFCKKQTNSVVNYTLSLKKHIKKIVIKDEERGLLFKNSLFNKLLKPGVYYFPPFVDIDVKIANINAPFYVTGYDVSIFIKNEQLAKELEVFEVKDYELGLLYEDGLFRAAYKAGKHPFFKGLKKREMRIIDKRIPEIDEKLFDLSLFMNPALYGNYYAFDVSKHEVGLLYFNNRFQKTLTEGRYYFWSGVYIPQIVKVDLRQQQIEINGQELMTLDKITIRLNFVSHYKIVNPEKLTHTINNYTQQIYILLQLILREYIGSLSLDDILKKKQEIGDYVLEKIKEKQSDFGIEFNFCGVKDIILPGEVKDILNTVLIAEKKAQANMIMRREEIASTRSLLNTAKLLDENETLYKLKEMEFIEKISDKIDSVSLSNGGSVLEQIQSLFLPKKK